MDVYQTIVPVPPESVYLLEKQIRDFDVVMGAFDSLETALHALDVTSRYRARDMGAQDSLRVVRIKKNSLNVARAVLATWTVTRTSELGAHGDLNLSPDLRTHDLSL